MHVDARTILLLTALMALVLAAYLGATVHAYPPHIRGLRRWSLANCACCGAWLFFALRGSVPEIVSILFGNALLLWAALSFDHAVHDFWGRRYRRRWYWMPPLVVVALLILTTVVPSFNARTVLVSSLLALVLGRGGFFLGRLSAAQRTPGSRATQLSFLLAAAISVFRIIDTALVRRGQSVNIFDQSSFELTLNVGACVGIVVLTVSFMTMCNERLSDEFRRLATLDPLTEINNRRAIEEIALRELDRARRDGRPVSLLVFDIDHFKEINDRHGHEAGDAALKSVVEVLRRSLRSHDLIGRIGGEEFVAVLPSTTLAEAERIAERSRQAIEANQTTSLGTSFRFTTCIGVAELGAPPEAYKEWLARGDLALYEAKRAGRNRVVVSPPL